MNNWALSYIYGCHFTMRSSKEENWDSGRPGIFLRPQAGHQSCQAGNGDASRLHNPSWNLALTPHPPSSLIAQTTLATTDTEAYQDERVQLLLLESALSGQ